MLKDRGAASLTGCRRYNDTVETARRFLTERSIDHVQAAITPARLYAQGLASLDVYGPTKAAIERNIEAQDTPAGSECGRALQQALEALETCLAERYQPIPSDHAALPCLLRHHRGVQAVSRALADAAAASDSVQDCDLCQIGEHFDTVVRTVTGADGVHVSNWKRPALQSSTFYERVQLKISLLQVSRYLGAYRVDVVETVPPHYHEWLHEHHVLVEKINGVHLLDHQAAPVRQADNLPIRPGQLHGFENHQGRPVAFVFVCGCRKLGPWHMVQDICTPQGAGFPPKKELLPSVTNLGGVLLDDAISHIRVNGRTQRTLINSPDGISQSLLRVVANHDFGTESFDRIYLVSSGEGILVVEGSCSPLASDDLFVIQAGMRGHVTTQAEMILYEFWMRDLSEQSAESSTNKL